MSLYQSQSLHIGSHSNINMMNTTSFECLWCWMDVHVGCEDRYEASLIDASTLHETMCSKLNEVYWKNHNIYNTIRNFPQWYIVFVSFPSKILLLSPWCNACLFFLTLCKQLVFFYCFRLIYFLLQSFFQKFLEHAHASWEMQADLQACQSSLQARVVRSPHP